MLPQFPDMSLTLEQQFDLKKFQQMVKDISRLEIEELLIMVLRQKMTHENISKSLIKECLKHNTTEMLSSVSQA